MKNAWTFGVLFFLTLVAFVSTATYFKTRRLYEGWASHNLDSEYDTDYIGGLGWGAGFGNWSGRSNKGKGWSVIWEGEPEGGVGIDQVFHKVSFEGELLKNDDAPSAEDTRNRLGGGWPGGNANIANNNHNHNSFGALNGDLTFYAPGTFMYGADSYVPSYESSVLLSPTLGVNAPPRRRHGSDADADSSSPCSSSSVLDREKYCQSLSAEQASNADCCVAMGGKYAMGGDEQGPHNRAVYTDPMVQGATDYYIHKGVCYGNCPGSNGL